MTFVPLSVVLPDANLPEGTVTAEDAQLLRNDIFFYGNAYAMPTGEDAPTHGRIDPREIQV